MSAQPKLSESQKTEALALIANGHTQTQVANKFGVSMDVIHRLVKKSENSQKIADLRESIRVRTLKRLKKLQPLIVDLTQSKADQLVDKPVVTVQDAATLDALSRAALNMEKVASSASGEALKLAQAQGGVSITIAPWASAKAPEATVIDVSPSPQSEGPWAELNPPLG